MCHDSYIIKEQQLGTQTWNVYFKHKITSSISGSQLFFLKTSKFYEFAYNDKIIHNWTHQLKI